jgi:uncharacterized membrane protein YsdA (DUF1294 family)
MSGPLVLGLAFLSFVNAGTLLCFWHDKRRALAGGWRIRESDLLSLALIGGSPAALLPAPCSATKSARSPSPPTSS